MPRVRLDRGALGLSAEAIDVPKEDFLNDNNYNENGEREWCRSVMGRQNFANTFDGEASRGCEHAQCDGDRGDWFGFAVTSGTGSVFCAIQNAESYPLLSSSPIVSRVLPVKRRRDRGRYSAAGRERGDQRHAPRLEERHQVVQNAVGRMLVKDALVAELLQVEL